MPLVRLTDDLIINTDDLITLRVRKDGRIAIDLARQSAMMIKLTPQDPKVADPLGGMLAAIVAAEGGAVTPEPVPVVPPDLPPAPVPTPIPAKG